ncbi:MAG: DNA polymerase I [Rickettsiales bacterium]|nr:DNA polymerase I [Rickettsiales bacterium]
MSKKIALIDGYGFVFRAYHSLPPLTNPQGTPVGAVYGFTNMLIKLLASLEVSHAAVVFDAGSKTFRNDIYPDYKANRPPCPEDLKPQFPIVRQSAESLSLPILEKAGFEADDIIATIAKQSAKQGYEVLIVSSDKDLMQLIDDNISMYDAMKNRLINEDQVVEKFMVKPKKVLDILALMGDSSDNIPGVKGIGPKTAAELINEFGSLEDIFNNLNKIKQNKRRQYLEEGEKNAKLSKILADLKDDVDVGINDIDELKLKIIDPHKLVGFLEAQGFKSLVSRVKREFNIIEDVKIQENSDNLSKKTVKTSKKQQIPYKNVKKTRFLPQHSQVFHEKAKNNGFITINFVENMVTLATNQFGELADEIFYFALDQETKSNNTSQENDLFSFQEYIPQDRKDCLNISVLDDILHDNSIKKIFFDAKYFFRNIYLDNFKNIENVVFEDVLLMNHLLNSSVKNDLRAIIDLNLEDDVEEMGIGEALGQIDKGKIPEEFDDQDKKIDILAFRNYAITKLYQEFNEEIFKQKLSGPYHIYEKPLLKTLAKMEAWGVKIDTKKLHDLSEEFGKKINELTGNIHNLAGEEFNIASTQQLSKILFEKLGLESKKKSKKTGALSTGAKVLEELAHQGEEIAKLILEFRRFSKLKNTYTDALPKEINPKTNRVHSHFSTTSTITGRLSSSNPNLQNIPIRTADGRKIRQCFISAPGHVLVSADYSQIELRVIAHVAKIDALTQAFKDNKDIHTITAAQVFNVTEDEVDYHLRSKAKAINFGIIYGISAFGLAKQLDISRTEAGDYIKSYLETYPGIDKYMSDSIELARKQGYVQTISGRKCFIKDINNKNPVLKNEAERLSINAPIQGSAADIIKKAMIALDQRLLEEKIDARIILQIHDELIIETKEENAKEIEDIIKQEMEQTVNLDCPLKVDVSVGTFWE